MKSNNIKKVAILLSLILAAAAIYFASYLHLFNTIELEMLDIRFNVRPNMPATDKVVIIEIGEDTIEKLGRFPFDRSYHALLVKALSEKSARAIVMDILFSEPAEHDDELEDALRHAKNVYLPCVLDIDAKKKNDMFYSDKYLVRAIENLRMLVKGEGHVNIEPDADGKFRRVPLYIRYKDSFQPFISFVTAADYLGIRQQDIKILPGKYLLMGPDIKIPLDEKSNMIINFSGKLGKIYQHYSYVDVVQSYLASMIGQKPILDLSIFRDKVCIIGLTATGTVDLHPNPLETLYPGVGIHAEIFNSIVNKRFITPVPREVNLIILTILCLLTMLVTLKTKPLKGFFILLAGILFFIFVAIMLFIILGLWISMSYPILIMFLLYLSITLFRYIAEWKKRLVWENELDIARKIQQSFLPMQLPSVAGVDMAATMFTAKQVGGDLYDFIDLGSGKFGIVIGDVSGKGVPASLYMAMVTGAIKIFAAGGASPNDVLSSLNNRLIRESSSSLFVTIFYMVFDMNNMTAVYANGGHLPVAYMGEGESKVKFLDVGEGTPLGLMEGAYSSGTIRFKERDTFVFYTDGVTEAMNTRGEMFGRERLSSMIERHAGTSSKTLLHAIEREIRDFEPKQYQHDDITLLCVKIL